MDAPSLSVYLSPGEYFVGDARYRVRTLLGSCVSITLWQRERRLGAMSHFLLAERGASRTSSTETLDGRYGTEALQLMLSGLAALGVAPQQCEAKLFGGGDMFPGHSSATPVQVGRRNGDAAHAMLDAQGIRLASHSLFGVGHRKIVFDIATGDVWSRQQHAASDTAPLSTLNLASLTALDAPAPRKSALAVPVRPRVRKAAP
jgi:chemotaxis protein CheD